MLQRYRIDDETDPCWIIVYLDGVPFAKYDKDHYDGLDVYRILGLVNSLR